MTYEEMRKYIADMVKSQGSKGAIEIAPLLYAMADKMFADPETGVVPIVVSIAEVGNKEGTAVRSLLQEKTYITIQSATA